MGAQTSSRETIERFFVLTLPRSRSKWLSVFLSPPGHLPCGHDLAVECSSISDFIAAVGLMAGTVETGAMVAWRLLMDRFPSSTFISIHRPLPEVIASLRRNGFPVDEAEMRRRERMLNEFSDQFGVLRYGYGELRSPAVCNQIFRVCLGGDPPGGHYEALAQRNIQIDIPARIARLRERAKEIEKLKAEVCA